MNPNITSILSKINFNDISRMQPKEISSTSLTNLKKIIEKLDINQITFLFDQSITKAKLIKICSYMYENDRKTFDYLNLLISNLPKTISKIIPQQVIQNQPNINSDATESSFDLVRIPSLFRTSQFQFEPRRLSSSVSRFSQKFPKIESDYYVILNSPNCDKFFMNLTIDSNNVVNSKYPVTSFPINITDSICEGYCHFRVSFHNLNGFVVFAIFTLEMLNPQEIESAIVNGKPHVKGGQWGFCPISHSLIKVPVRGINCSHTDVFDLQSYVDSSLRTAMWECPICGKPLPFDELSVDDDAYKEMRNIALENPDFFMKSFS
ncbi:hypothetical protein M9Y10_033838 [Tritrichomonas musculus]|uniref:SP-RING-type domain-containing protein n=1 Tax=Tritrichomonas musculus TaxID=1915356 RepID=A0ABR2KD87_9EUKA